MLRSIGSKAAVSCRKMRTWEPRSAVMRDRLKLLNQWGNIGDARLHQNCRNGLEDTRACMKGESEWCGRFL